MPLLEDRQSNSYISKENTRLSDRLGRNPAASQCLGFAGTDILCQAPKF
jgi:hypothetical protein